MQGGRDARGLTDDGSVLGVHDRGQTQVEQSIPTQIPPQKKAWAYGIFNRKSQGLKATHHLSAA